MTTRINLSMTDSANKKLEELAKDAGGSKSEIIRRALKLYALAEQEKKEGKKLAIINDKDEIEAKVVGF
jgi:metal-responsive CopG/Arc/MetJ family transcriptional regulator